MKEIYNVIIQNMNNLVIDKQNFWKVIDQLYSIIQDNKSNVVIHYEVLRNSPKRSLNNDRLSARKTEKIYRSVDDLFISELWKNVHDQVIN